MAENEGQSESVSKEAHERVKRELDAANAKLGEATKALSDYTKRDRARSALVGKVAPEAVDSIADLVTPHLTDVEPDAISEFLAQDRFKALYASSPAVPAVNGDGEGEGPVPAQEPAQGGFSGPSPAGDSGSTPLGTKDKIAVGSPEYRKLIESNDSEAVEAAYKEGLISSPSRPW